jgi:sulfate permease, SulP family
MQIGSYKFDRLEFAGSLGDLGTLIPLSAAMIVLCGLNAASVLLMIGLFYIGAGIYYKLPIPVQPLKVVAAVAIAFPDKITAQVIAAAGIIFGLTLFLIAATGIIDKIAKIFTKPIVRGIQLGLGFILIKKGIGFIVSKNLFVCDIFSLKFAEHFVSFLNPIIGIIGFVIAFLLLTNKKFPASLVVISIGIIIGFIFGAPNKSIPISTISDITFFIPSLKDFETALLLLVIPQIPLTIGNAVIGTKDACIIFFGKGEKTEKATNRAFAFSMGITNVIAGIIGAVPMCHGAGGLAAHYRFGARTGGSNIMIGAFFTILAIFFGKQGFYLLSSIPSAIFGILLIFAGIELGLLILDIKDKDELFVTLLIAAIGFSSTNMSLAIICGLIIERLFRFRKNE